MSFVRVLILLVAAAFFGGCVANSRIDEPVSDSDPIGPVRVSDSANAAEPAVAVTKDGNALVVWVEHNDGGADVFVRPYDAAGNASGEKVRVNPTPLQAKAWRGDPPTIIVGNSGEVYVGWTAAIPDALGTTLYVSLSQDSGGSFLPPVKVNDDIAPASHGMHSLAVDASNTVYVAWLDERYLAGHRPPEHHAESTDAAEPNAELFFAKSLDGGKSFSPNQRIASDVCPCCKTALAVSKTGKIYAGWRQVLPGSFRHIAVASSIDGGNSFSPPAIVSDDQWKIEACPVSGPALSVDGDELRVAWFAGGDRGPHGVYWTHTHDAGSTFSPPLIISEATSMGTPVITGNTLVWSDVDQFYSANISEHSASQRSQPSNGQFPAAAGIHNTFIAYTKPEGGRSSVWLTVR